VHALDKFAATTETFTPHFTWYGMASTLSYATVYPGSFLLKLLFLCNVRLRFEGVFEVLPQ